MSQDDSQRNIIQVNNSPNFEDQLGSNDIQLPGSNNQQLSDNLLNNNEGNKLDVNQFEQLSISTEMQTQSSIQREDELPNEHPSTTMPHLLCKYKGTGNRGTQFKSSLETNYLKLMIDEMNDFAYHYDVTIEPDRPKKHLVKVFHQFCLNNFPNIGIAFDGSRNAYAPTMLQLENVKREVNFTDPETGGVRVYLVNVKETADMEISMKSLKT